MKKELYSPENKLKDEDQATCLDSGTTIKIFPTALIHPLDRTNGNADDQLNSDRTNSATEGSEIDLVLEIKTIKLELVEMLGVFLNHHVDIIEISSRITHSMDHSPIFVKIQSPEDQINSPFLPLNKVFIKEQLNISERSSIHHDRRLHE